MEVTTVMTIEVTAIEKNKDVTLEDYSEESKAETEKRIAEFLSASLVPTPDDIHVEIKTFLKEENK